ncbi:MAG TPA: DUF58 domain-containing protein [Streptosporangiaceae bacterium]|nr:DUF58 domain-containing protein [Streptosporangiaceae bacterium]
MPRSRQHHKLAQLVPERQLRRLELIVSRRLEGLLNGEHIGLLPGPGTELAEARVYQPGEDDVRHMDWAVTARTTTPHVRDLIADRELEAWALVDLSASMDFGTAAMEKRDLAVAALAAVGFLTARLGDRFGAYLMHQGAVRRIPARTGKAALYAMLQSILDTERTTVVPGAARSARAPGAGGGVRGFGGAGLNGHRDRWGGRGPAGSGEAWGDGAATRARRAPGPERPELADALTGLARGQTRRGLRVIISDFIDPDDGHATAPRWERPMRRLAARHQVLAVEIVDPRELELPDVGLVQMEDPETGVVREIVLSRRVQAAYAQAAAAQRARIRDALRRCAVPHLVLRTDRDWVSDVARFALRQRRVAGRPQGVRI